MRNRLDNMHLSPISLYTKSTFLGLLLLCRLSCRRLGFVSKCTTYHFVHLVRDFASVETRRKAFLEYGFSRIKRLLFKLKSPDSHSEEMRLEWKHVLLLPSDGLVLASEIRPPGNPFEVTRHVGVPRCF